ncbi:MAG: hypothetical protein P4L73_18435 [Caulobacteraceae bacterium]|nr:hypothetical protein [Caulobacteraceae bacterium]
MRAPGIGLAAALIVAMMASTAFARDSDISPDQRKAGMKAAPALITAAKLPCTLADARMMGEGVGADKVKSTYYEIACKDALGYVLAVKDKDPTPTAYDCVMMSTPGPDGKPNPSSCKLPGNANPAASLTPVVAQTGRACAVDKARYIGSSPEQSFYEVACHEGGGYILQWPKAAGATPTASMCLAFGPTSNVKCELTPPEQQMVVIDQLVAGSGKTCTVKDRRYIGSTADHSDFFEVACADGKGFMLEADATGKLKQAVDCAKAQNIGGGCTLTDTRLAQTEQNTIYSDLAKKAGFDCAVSKYADFPTQTDGVEVVELACSNRPDGGVGYFPNKGAPIVWDCLRAETEGYKCSYSQPDALYSKFSSQLKARNKGSCVVNGARAYGRTTAGADLIEVACNDGAPGWVLEYAAGSNVPTDLLNCAQASQTGGGGCQLPTNKGH